MSYVRVIPRDLFNDANLLKCLGRISVAIIDGDPTVRGLTVDDRDIDRGFDIHQDPHTGDTFCANLEWNVGGIGVYFSRPLNSREPWPLYATADGWDAPDITVFTPNGDFTGEFAGMIAELVILSKR